MSLPFWVKPHQKRLPVDQGYGISLQRVLYPL